MAVPAQRRQLVARDHVPAPHSLVEVAHRGQFGAVRRERQVANRSALAGYRDGWIALQDGLDLPGGRVPERRRSGPIPGGQERAIGGELQADDVRFGFCEASCARGIVGQVAELDDPVLTAFGQGLAVAGESDGGNDPAGPREGLWTRNSSRSRIMTALSQRTAARVLPSEASAWLRLYAGDKRVDPSASPLSTSQVAIAPPLPERSAAVPSGEKASVSIVPQQSGRNGHARSRPSGAGD